MFLRIKEFSSDFELKNLRYNPKIIIEPTTTPKAKTELFGCPKTVILYETKVALRKT